MEAELEPPGSICPHRLRASTTAVSAFPCVCRRRECVRACMRADVVLRPELSPARRQAKPPHAKSIPEHHPPAHGAGICWASWAAHPWPPRLCLMHCHSPRLASLCTCTHTCRGGAPARGDGQFHMCWQRLLALPFPWRGRPLILNRELSLTAYAHLYQVI